MTNDIKVQFEFNEGKPFGTEIDRNEAVTILAAWINGEKNVDADMYKVELSDVIEIKFFK